MTLFERVQKLAKIHGMNVKEVAIKAGLSENAIYGWKTHVPTKATIKEVARIVGSTYEELTGEKENIEPTKIDLGAALDDSDDVIMTFDGKPIPDEDKELIKRLLRGK
ncbi:helix-turn-helix domain-containing protein [Paucilactobacillus kaifaensis]|uniref:helix-turn-helix domain-containing protein n=1 Tax=Paucilactobacillus kaifaensis TaxID=2559921 RepID=UPI0010F7B69F|nr:helix-turn-helix transcriptional regulator [Paucilactobacillus kaifaensis]